MFVIFEQVIVLNKKRSSVLFLLEDKALQRNTNKVRTDELISETVKAGEISSPRCFLTSFQHSAPKNYLASHQWFFLNPKALILNFHWSLSIWILTHKLSCWLFTLVHRTYRFSCWSCSRAWIASISERSLMSAMVSSVASANHLGSTHNLRRPIALLVFLLKVFVLPNRYSLQVPYVLWSVIGSCFKFQCSQNKPSIPVFIAVLFFL